MSEDRIALEELARLSAPGSVQIVVHYVYVPSRAAAAELALILRSHGFRTEERLGADAVNWLVLARHRAVLTLESITEVRALMEERASSLAGEYDGWEVELVDDP